MTTNFKIKLNKPIEKSIKRDGPVEKGLQSNVPRVYPDLTWIVELIDTKVDKVEGKELSSNDFTDELDEKLQGINKISNTEIEAIFSDI